VLVVDHTFPVSLVLPRTRIDRGHLQWVVEPNKSEREYITLLCTMNQSKDRLLGFYLFPRMNWPTPHRMYMYDPALRGATRLRKLSDFYSAVRILWRERPDKTTLHLPIV